MDIFWANASGLQLPSSQRVEVLVHDGATDLNLWPGPGADRNLIDAYGPGLREALEAQRNKHGGSVPIGEPVRVHPGKLHCNYLLWVPTRGPEVNAQQADAPGIDIIEQAVMRCLEFAAKNGSLSIAFGALGDGPKAQPPEQRLAAVVRAAHKYFETSVASGRAASLEIVRVCDARSGVTAAARKLVGRLAQTAPEPVVPKTVETERERMPRKTLSLSGSGKARPNAATRGRKVAETLDPAEVSYRRANARPYDRANRYAENDWFVHARFGVGQVKKVTPDGAIDVLFEDGSTKKMLHGHQS